METLEQLQKTIDNAPSGATHFMEPDSRAPVIYIKATPLHDFYWNIANSNTDWFKALDRQIGIMRSLSDIKRIIELEKRLAETRFDFNHGVKCSNIPNNLAM